MAKGTKNLGRKIGVFGEFLGVFGVDWGVFGEVWRRRKFCYTGFNAYVYELFTMGSFGGLEVVVEV